MSAVQRYLDSDRARDDFDAWCVDNDRDTDDRAAWDDFAEEVAISAAEYDRGVDTGRW